MSQSEQINELITALAKAQGSMSAASKDCSNPFFKSKYADLSSIWNACREPLSSNGLAVIQTVQQRENGDILYTILAHSSGQWISSSIPLRIKSDGKTNELQVMGSCLTYLRRYALSAIVGVAPDEDDDGNSGRGYQARNEPSTNVKNITIEQQNELRKILEKCSPSLKENISKMLKDRGFDGFHMIHESLFNTIMNRALKDAQDYKDNLLKEEKAAI